MNQCWSHDFSYNYFKKILRAAKANFEQYLLSEAPRIIEEPNSCKLVLRHDVDVSLRRAYAMAKIEESCGIRASYMVMAESSLYNINDDISRDILGKIVAMKHEIGLHIDPCKCGNEPIEEEIDYACNKLENLIRTRVQTVSFHRPPEASLKGPLMIGSRVNAYSKKLQEWYMSDSSGRWRDGEPLPKLLKPVKPLLQLLIHPIWWGDKHMSAQERLRAFCSEESQGKPLNYSKVLRNNIIETIGVEFECAE